MSDEADVTVTMKVREGSHGDPWLVFRGAVVDVQTNLVQAFGLDGSGVEDGEETLLATVLRADEVAKSVGAVVTQLGGKVVSGSERATEGTDPWDRGARPARAAEPSTDDTEPEEPTLLDLVSRQMTVKELQVLWAENTPAFQADPEAQAAWKARGKELQAKEKG